MKTIINQNQTGILVRDGRIVGLVSAGVYRTYAFRNETIVVYPSFAQSYAYAVNVRTAEAAAVSVDVSAGITIKDAKKLYLSGKTAYEVVSRAIASQLQAAAETKTLSELLEGNPDLLRLLLGQKAKSINVAFDATGRNIK